MAITRLGFCGPSAAYAGFAAKAEAGGSGSAIFLPLTGVGMVAWVLGLTAWTVRRSL